MAKIKLQLAAGAIAGALALTGCQADTPGASDEPVNDRPVAAVRETAATGATLTQEQANRLAQNYLQVWQVSDVAQRDTLVRTLFTEDAVHYVSPGDISFAGRDKIEANITTVHDEQIQKAGLAFTVGGAERNRDTMKLDWKIATPAGATVLSGTDVFVLDENGRIRTLYMFHQPVRTQSPAHRRRIHVTP
ncbi:MAG: hypothetical protein QOI21_6256 [Actinomycetota bacterium]|jgi:hypothetical protein|nr:hypothetical protein [Actinomycetota bacterium]